jgi:hypothetical protein
LAADIEDPVVAGLEESGRSAAASMNFGDAAAPPR